MDRAAEAIAALDAVESQKQMELGEAAGRADKSEQLRATPAHIFWEEGFGSVNLYVGEFRTAADLPSQIICAMHYTRDTLWVDCS